MDVEIRQEELSDLEAISAVTTSAFKRDNECKLIGLLRAGESFVPELSLVAIVDNKVVGHALFTKISIRSDDGTGHESLALAPIAVDPDYQKKGIGRSLIKRGLATAQLLRFKSVIVLGHENYYPKFGFAPTQKWNIRCPFDAPTTAFMGIELEPGSLAQVVSGIVKYPKVFDDV